MPIGTQNPRNRLRSDSKYIYLEILASGIHRTILRRALDHKQVIVHDDPKLRNVRCIVERGNESLKVWRRFANIRHASRGSMAESRIWWPHTSATAKNSYLRELKYHKFKVAGFALSRTLFCSSMPSNPPRPIFHLGFHSA